MGLDTVELLWDAEKHFGVSISQEQAEDIVTVEQFAQVLWQLQQHSNSALSYGQVLTQLQTLIADRFDIPIERITPTARIIADLGLNQ